MSVVWFRQDLRLDDNPSLEEAVNSGGPVVPIYIWTPKEEGDWAPGPASQWWHHQSLGSLDSELHRIGSRLIVLQGPSGEGAWQIVHPRSRYRDPSDFQRQKVGRCLWGIEELELDPGIEWASMDQKSRIC